MGILGAVVFAFCVWERRESTKTLESAAIGMALQFCIEEGIKFELMYEEYC